MATKVKTEAETDMPWTIPLILQTMLPNGQPGEKIEITYWEMILAKLYTLIGLHYCLLKMTGKWYPIIFSLFNFIALTMV